MIRGDGSLHIVEIKRSMKIQGTVNYLVGLDENREQVREPMALDVRRGQFNTHHSRVEVLTYKELVDSAERSLKL